MKACKVGVFIEHQPHIQGIRGHYACKIAIGVVAIIILIGFKLPVQTRDGFIIHPYCLLKPAFKLNKVSKEPIKLIVCRIFLISFFDVLVDLHPRNASLSFGKEYRSLKQRYWVPINHYSS